LLPRLPRHKLSPLTFSGRLDFCPADGGRVELPDVFGRVPSLASSSATRTVSPSTCRTRACACRACSHGTRITASFSSSEGPLRSSRDGRGGIHRLNLTHRQPSIPHAAIIRSTSCSHHPLRTTPVPFWVSRCVWPQTMA
jgi:hypothetical protein